MATVAINQGALRGSKSKTNTGFEYYGFLGIPYAKPPVGTLRFKSPQAPDNWEGERDATTIDLNNICCQFDFMLGQIIGSEDCLYLNVYTPTLPSSDSNPLPVMVYIHGGGFVRGDGITNDEGGPEFLLEHNVVVVTINYRLGVLGFLSLDIPEAAGNVGLKDQVKALEWIQSNIAKFGGDPNNVTLFGASTGSASVDHLIISPLAKNLFHKAILQSGSSINHWAVNYEHKVLVKNLLTELHYIGNMYDPQEVLQYLQDLPSSTLAQAAHEVQDKILSKRIGYGFVPTIETDFKNGDAFLTENPYTIFEEGKFHPVPVIRGFCNEEGLLVKVLNSDEYQGLIETKKFTDHFSCPFGKDEELATNEKFRKAYLKKRKGDKFGIDFFTDLDFAAGSLIASNLMSRKQVPVYVYQFAYNGKSNIVKRMFGLKSKGAVHCDDVGYILCNNMLNLEDESDRLIKERLTTMWTNFAKFSNPTPETSDRIPTTWPQYTEKSQAYLKIDRVMTIKTNYEPAKMAVFEEIYNKYKK